jgi:hypothetical protein
METQGLSQGSLRNSHRETHAIQRKPAAASLQALGSKVLETCFKDIVIRQHLDPERVEPILKRAPMFVLENESRAEPGFLVILPEKPVLYMQQRRGRDGAKSWSAYTLRMRVASCLGENGGTVLLARLDDVMHMLQLEDVWLWKGVNVFETTTFTERRGLLREFVERHWIPDARLLGGIFTTVAQYKSLEEFSKKGAWQECYSVEFVPDTPGKRRMVLYLEERVKAASGPAAMKQERGGGASVAVPAPGPAAVVAPVTPVANIEATRRFKATPVDKMPDVYDLYGEDGFPVSRASVQNYNLSTLLRVKVKAEKVAWVAARWKAEFGGYEIVGIAPSPQEVP